MVDDDCIELKHNYIKLTGSDARKIIDWRISRLVRIFGSAVRDEELKDDKNNYAISVTGRKQKDEM